jgi:ketosteroid isomerase-like protein
MKVSLFVATLLFFSLSFASRVSSQPTEDQKEQIKREINAVFDSAITKWERLDNEAALACYSPDCIFFAVDGSRWDFQTYRKSQLELRDSESGYKWTNYDNDFLSITKDIVVCSCDGKNEIFLKSGDKVTYDPSHYSLVYKKIAGQWKIIYQHFSGALVTQKAEKK